MAGRDDLMLRLDALGIRTETREHPPLHTVEESRALRGSIPGGHIKNLFLKDKKGMLFLLVAEEEAEIDMKALHRRIGSARLSFGRPELLDEVLGVRPGAVTPFAAMNDTDRRVRILLDAALRRFEVINAHPLENVATTSIRLDDLLRFLKDTGHEPEWIDLAAPLPENGPALGKD